MPILTRFFRSFSAYMYFGLPGIRGLHLALQGELLPVSMRCETPCLTSLALKSHVNTSGYFASRFPYASGKSEISVALCDSCFFVLAYSR